MSIMVMVREDEHEVVRCTDCPDWREVTQWGLIIAHHHNITKHDSTETVVDRRS